MEHGMMPLDEHGLHADVDYMQHPDNGDDQGRVNARPTAMANPLELLCDVAAPSGSYVTSKGMGGMQLDYGDKSGGLAIPESAVIAYPMYGEPDVPPGTKMVLLPCEATPYGWKCLEVAIPADVSLTVKSPVRMWKVLPADQPEVSTHGMHMQAQVGVPTNLASPGNALLTLAAIAQSPLSGGPPNKKQKTAKNAEPKPPRKLNDEERIIVEEMYQIWGGPRQGIKDGIQVQHLSEKVINWLDVCDARNISLKQAQELSEGYKAGFDKNDPAVPQYVFNSGTFNTTFARVLYARVSRLPESFKVHDYITERDTIGKWMDSKKWNIKDAVDAHIKEQNNSAFEKFWREAGKRRLRILAECLNFDQLRTRVEQEFGI